MSVKSMQARVNPVYLTAKTAVCLMERAKIPGAEEIACALALDDKALLQSCVINIGCSSPWPGPMEASMG